MGNLKQLSHDDVVLFDCATQLQEYQRLSGDEGISIAEWEDFPRIQSKHWSFHCSFNNGNHFEIKQTALTRLVSYQQYKKENTKNEPL
jgi:hypothetical protein